MHWRFHTCGLWTHGSEGSASYVPEMIKESKSVARMVITSDCYIAICITFFISGG